MSKYVFTNKAVEDLTEIWNYTCDKWSENQADKYYHSNIHSCEFISENPDLGRQYDFAINVLGYPLNKHIIFYRTRRGEKIEITRILHERMEIEQKIKKNNPA